MALARRLAALKMVVWHEGKAAALAKLLDAPCPLLAQKLPYGEIDVGSLSTRISAA